MYPGLATPSYFEINGKPAVILEPAAFPQVLQPTGKWEVLYDLPKFRENSERIDKAEWDAMVAKVPNAETPTVD
jgi:hypothetical protein